MLWMILIIVGIVLITLGKIFDANDFDGIAVISWIAGGGMLLISVSFMCAFVYGKHTYPVTLAQNKQQYEIIVSKLDNFSENSNTNEAFASAYNEAGEYNTNLLKIQNTYKCTGALIDYNDDRILNLPLIPMEKYSIKDADMVVKINK
jgi:hypothetical protein